jgi:hypothetical protein
MSPKRDLRMEKPGDVVPYLRIQVLSCRLRQYTTPRQLDLIGTCEARCLRVQVCLFGPLRPIRLSIYSLLNRSPSTECRSAHPCFHAGSQQHAPPSPRPRPAWLGGATAGTRRRGDSSRGMRGRESGRRGTSRGASRERDARRGAQWLQGDSSYPSCRRPTRLRESFGSAP